MAKRKKTTKIKLRVKHHLSQADLCSWGVEILKPIRFRQAARPNLSFNVSVKKVKLHGYKSTLRSKTSSKLIWASCVRHLDHAC